MVEGYITPAEFAKTARRKAGTLSTEAKFRGRGDEVVTILHTSERTGILQRTHNVIFNVRNERGIEPPDKDGATRYGYRELQVHGSTAIFRTGVGNYDSGEYSLDRVPLLLEKVQENERTATPNDLEKMFDIAVSLNRSNRLDAYGRAGYERKRESAFFKHLNHQGMRLLSLARSQDMLRHVPREEYKFPFVMDTASYATNDYYYHVLKMSGGGFDKVSISECYFPAQYANGEVQVFPAISYEADSRQRGVAEQGAAQHLLQPDGRVLTQVSSTFRLDMFGIFHQRQNPLLAYGQRKDFINRLRGLSANNLVRHDNTDGIFARQKR